MQSHQILRIAIECKTKRTARSK